MTPEADLDLQSVGFVHINPILDYFGYTPESRCFVCGSYIKDGMFPYPGFDLHLFTDERPLVQTLFEKAGSFVIPERWDVPESFGAFVVACQTHRDNLRELRAKFKDPDIYTHSGKISLQAIEEAKK